VLRSAQVSFKVLQVASGFEVREISTASIVNASSSALLNRAGRLDSHRMNGEIAIIIPSYPAFRARFPVERRPPATQLTNTFSFCYKNRQINM